MPGSRARQAAAYFMVDDIGFWSFVVGMSHPVACSAAERVPPGRARAEAERTNFTSAAERRLGTVGGIARAANASIRRCHGAPNSEASDVRRLTRAHRRRGTPLSASDSTMRLWPASVARVEPSAPQTRAVRSPAVIHVPASVGAIATIAAPCAFTSTPSRRAPTGDGTRWSRKRQRVTLAVSIVGPSARQAETTGDDD
jgi:hypothetical protein